MKRHIVVMGFLVLAAMTGLASGQTPPAKKPTPATSTPAAMTNADVIKMANAGLSDDLIMGAIVKAARTKFDLSADGLIALKTAKVSDAVIKTMLNPTAPLPAITAPAVAPAAKPAAVPPPAIPPTPGVPSIGGSTVQHVGVSFDQPSTVALDGVTEAGIYLKLSDGNLELLEPTVYSGEASGNKFGHMALAFIPQNTQAVVRSLHANQRVKNPQPVFFFFFEKGGAGLSNTGGTFVGYMNSASSPNEFALVRMKESTDERQITTAKNSSIKDRVGVPSKDTIDVTFKRLKPGVYQLQPKSPLTPGEYCFFYQGGAADKGGVGKLFDFGVDTSTDAK